MTSEDLKEQSALTRAALLGQLGARRKQLGLSQEELASRIGASRMSVSRAESTEADCQLSTFISMALGVNLLPHLSEAGEANESTTPHPEEIIHRGLAYSRVNAKVPGRDRERELALAASWETVNRYTRYGVSSLMPALVPGHTQAQATAAATAIQWLGSEVGFDFLRRALESAGYKIVSTR